MRILLIKILMLAGFVQAQQASKPAFTASEKRILIVYVSRTNNTQAVAQLIQKQVGGTISRLETVQPYPVDYQKMVDQVADENRRGYHPPLQKTAINPANFDLIFIGFPTWGMQLPPPVKSYLSEYDFRGKTIIPFNTHAGYGSGRTFDEVKTICAASTVLPGFSAEGGKEKEGKLFVLRDQKHQQVESEIKQWLLRIGLY